MNTWEGKTVCFLGDSITDGVGVQPGERYLDILGERMKFNACGYGVNGARFIDLYSQALKMNEEHGKNVDAIFIFAGTNDFCGSTIIGDWYTETAADVATIVDENERPVRVDKRIVRSFNMDTSCFKGSINYVLSYLKHNYPQSQIILLTPIHRAFARFSVDNIQYNEMYSNNISKFIGDYVNAVKEAANVWATELIDMNAVSGLFPLYDEWADFFADKDIDRLHPGRLGHIRMADVLEKKMQSIALF